MRSASDDGKKIQLRYMETDIYLQVPPEIPINCSVKDPQDYHTTIVCGLTSVSVVSIMEHEMNASVTVPEPPYHSTEVQGLRMESDAQDPESQKSPSKKSPAKRVKNDQDEDAGFRTPTPKKKPRASAPAAGTGSPGL